MDMQKQTQTVVRGDQYLNREKEIGAVPAPLGASYILIDAERDLVPGVKPRSCEADALWRSARYLTKRIDMKRAGRDNTWNSLYYLKDGNVRENVDIFCKCLMLGTLRDDDEFYERAELELLKAIILRIVLSHEWDHVENKLRLIYDFLNDGGGMDFLDDLFRAEKCVGGLEDAHKAYKAFQQGSINFCKAARAKLEYRMNILVDDRLCELFGKDDVDLVLPLERKCVYFIETEDRHDMTNHIPVLFIAQMIVAMANKIKERSSNRKVIVIAPKSIVNKLMHIGYKDDLFPYMIKATPDPVLILAKADTLLWNV